MITTLLGKVWSVMPYRMRRAALRISQDTFTVSVAAIVTDGGGKILLLDHHLRGRNGWGLPGGFVEKGEQPAKAIEREIREETGLQLADVRLCRVRTIGAHVEIIYRARGVGTAEVRSGEIARLDWFEPSALPERMSPAQKKLVAEVLRAEFEKTKGGN